MAEEKEPAAKTVRAPRSLIVDSRKTFTATGVSNVDSFDDQTVTVYTGFDEIAIHGRNLQIGKLSTEAGELTIMGGIYSVTYTDQKQGSEDGVFSKMLRQRDDGVLGLILEKQGQGFLTVLAVGLALGALYDAFRISRMLARSEKRQVTRQDIFVCFVATVMSFLAALAANWGKAWFYPLAGGAIGMYVYFLALDEITFRLAKLLLRILAAVKNFLLRWILRPIRRLFRRVLHGMCTICIKIAKVTTKSLKFRKKGKKSLEISPSDNV